MTFPTSTPERLLWGILALLVAGYMVGSFINRRRSRSIGFWLRGGIGRLGGKPAWKIIRNMSSGGGVVVGDPDTPFRRVDIAWGLLTRELPPLWGVELLRGRRDTLAVRAELRAEPACEVQVLPFAGSLRRKLDEASMDRPWEWQHGPAGLGIATRADGGQLDAKLAGGIGRFLERYGTYVQRLSVRDERPHLMLFLSLGKLEQSSTATAVFDAIRELGKAVRAEP